MYLRSLQTKISNLKESILDSEDVLMPKLLTYLHVTMFHRKNST
jgi:hypothetical protein